MPTAYDKQINVTITQPGFAAYNGYLRRHLFKDGKSVGKIPVRMALLLGASCSVIDTDTGEQLNPNTYKFEQIGEVSADDFPSVTAIRKSDVINTEVAKVAEEAGAALDDGPMGSPESDSESDSELVDDKVGFVAPGDEHEDPRIWSLAELEAIADADGITGLREIGGLIGVKNRSLDGLIQAILKAQVSEPLDTKETPGE